MSKFLLLLVLAQTDGLTVERRVRVVSRDTVGKASEYVRTEVVKIQGGKVAIEDVTFGARLVIRPDLALAWVIDVQGATYSELDFASVARRRAQELTNLAEARKRVAGTQDADDIERVLIGLGTYASPPSVAVKDTGREETIAGRKCTGRSIVVNETDVAFDVLVDPTLADGLAYFDALAAVGGFHPDIAAKLKTLGGFPLKGKVRYALFLDRVFCEEEVTSVARGPVAAADFDLPAKLKKVPLKGFDPDAGPKPEKPKNFAHTFREDDIERDTNPLKKPEKKEPEKDK
jgi:hypothetical protein